MCSMAYGRTTHVLFDFFGTLVDYSAALDGASAAGDCAALIRSYGGGVDEPGFIVGWDAAYRGFESRAYSDQREFSMDQLSRSYLAEVLDRGPEAAGIRAYLIDPTHAYDIPNDQRLESLSDLPSRLFAAAPGGDFDPICEAGREPS
jgi:FMN phosphatase YigB (HAD superfamily)